jgi:sodium/hydrogen antiporter
VAVITITVMLSVVTHGATADPLAARYARLLARQADQRTGAAVPGIPERRLIRRTTSRTTGTGAAGGEAAEP